MRLSVKRGMAPTPGSFVEVKASLEPPLQPLEPGSYDFARDLFFQASARPALPRRAEFWRQMGYGIERMNAVGLWVASLPGAYGRVPLFGTGPLLLATAGFVVVGLLKTPLRWSGAVAVVAAAIWAAFAPCPNVLIAADGRGFAVRGNDGRLAIHHIGDNFAVREWLAADADGRDVHDKRLGQGIACDASGCIGRLADGALVAYALSPEGYEEDCTRTALVVASRGDPPSDCKATVIDRALWRQHGALLLSRRGSEFIIESARSKNFDRQ